MDGQVGTGPVSGAGGKVEGVKAGGPGLYMIEPSGLYWVRVFARRIMDMLPIPRRVITEPPLEKADRPPKPSWKSWT